MYVAQLDCRFLFASTPKSFAADSELERNVVALSLEHRSDCDGCIARYK